MNTYVHPAINLIVTTLLSKKGTSSMTKGHIFVFHAKSTTSGTSVNLDKQNAMYQIQIGLNCWCNTQLIVQIQHFASIVT